MAGVAGEQQGGQRGCSAVKEVREEKVPDKVSMVTGWGNIAIQGGSQAIMKTLVFLRVRRKPWRVLRQGWSDLTCR